MKSRSQDNICQGRPALALEQARNTRTRAWAYVFECFNRRVNQEGSPILAALNDTRGEPEHDSRTEPRIQ